MKHAFGREVRFAGHRNAGFAAASRRLNPTHRWGLRSHPSLCDAVWDGVAETGLERPAYSQMPLRGNENVQTLRRVYGSVKIHNPSIHREVIRAI